MSKENTKILENKREEQGLQEGSKSSMNKGENIREFEQKFIARGAKDFERS